MKERIERTACHRPAAARPLHAAPIANLRMAVMPTMTQHIWVFGTALQRRTA